MLLSHLRMTGRWRIERRGANQGGRPWLILRGSGLTRPSLWNRPVLGLARDARRIARLGPDILSRPPDFDAVLERLRAEARSCLQSATRSSTRVVAGSATSWKAEAAPGPSRVSPWLGVETHRRRRAARALAEAYRLMRTGLEERGRSGASIAESAAPARAAGRRSARSAGRRPAWPTACPGVPARRQATEA